MTAAIYASQPRPSRPAQERAGARRTTASRTWRLTLLALRELTPIQGAIQAAGVVVVTVVLIMQASGLLPEPSGLPGRPADTAFVFGGYCLFAFGCAAYLGFTHGVVMATRTPAWLRAGLTRSAVMAHLTQTGLLLGAASTAVCGLRTIPDVLLKDQVTGIRLTAIPQLAVQAAPAVLLCYLVGACVTLLFLRRPWWVGTTAILVGLSVGSLCVGQVVAHWGTPWAAAWIALGTALLVVIGPLGTWLQLRRYEPRQ